MTRLFPGLTLYIDRSSKNVTLQSYAVDPQFGMSIAAGEFIRFDWDTFRFSGLDVCVENLRGYAKRRRLGRSEFERMSRKDQREFEAQHFDVGIGSDERLTVLTVQGMKRNSRGGHEGFPEDRFELLLPCSNELFLETVEKALERCD